MCNEISFFWLLTRASEKKMWCYGKLQGESICTACVGFCLIGYLFFLLKIKATHCPPYGCISYLGHPIRDITSVIIRCARVLGGGALFLSYQGVNF